MIKGLNYLHYEMEYCHTYLKLDSLILNDRDVLLISDCPFIPYDGEKEGGLGGRNRMY